MQKLKGSEKSTGSYLYPQVSDGVPPPVPDRPATEVIYDNKVTKENDNTSDPSNTDVERTSVVEGDTKRETRVVGVENDIYSGSKQEEKGIYYG